MGKYGPNHRRNVGLEVIHQTAKYGINTPPATYPAIRTDCGHGFSSALGLDAGVGLGGKVPLRAFQARRDTTKRGGLPNSEVMVDVKKRRCGEFGRDLDGNSTILRRINDD